MKKILFLAVALIMSVGAWADVTEVTAITPSTTAEPVLYRMWLKDASNNLCVITENLKQGGFDEGAKEARFIFIATGETNEYYMYETQQQKYVKATSSNNATKSATGLVETADDACKWTIVASTTAKRWLISPKGRSTYMNFYQGLNDNKTGQTIGFWTDGNNDQGSRWAFDLIDGKDNPYFNLGEVYRMQLREGETGPNQNYHFFYNKTTGQIETRTSENADAFDANHLFFFKKVEGGYTLHCIASGDKKGFEVSSANNSKGSITSTPTVFSLQTNSNGGFTLQHTAAVSHVNDISGVLGVWANGSYSQNDKGSKFTLTPITDADIESVSDATEEVKNAAKADHSYTNVAALFATTATPEEIAALQEKINDLLDLFGGIVSQSVGYPSFDAESVDKLIEYAEAFGGEVNAENYSEAEEALEDVYAETNINLPEAGKAYKMYFQGTSKKFYVKSAGNALTENADEADIVVVGISGENERRFYFASNTHGNFMHYRGFENDGVATYADNTCLFSVKPLVAATNSEATAKSKEERFGLVYLSAAGRPSENGVGGMVVQESNGTFNKTANPFFNGNYTSGVVFEEVEDYTANVVVFNEAAEKDGKYVGTYYSTYAVTLPEGVEAYTATAGEESLSLTKVDGSVLPKKTPVVLTCTEADEKGVLLVPAAATPAAVTGNVLSGTAVEQNADGSEYVLSVVNTKVGFYKFVGSTLAANKAYYVPTTTSEVQGFVLNFGGEQTTGIISVNENANASVNCFDLAGRRVNANVKGISIVNGKKIVK